MFPDIVLSCRVRPNSMKKALTPVTATYVTDTLFHHSSTGYLIVNCTHPSLTTFNFSCSLFAVYFRLNFDAVRCSTALHHQMTRLRSINASILGQLDRSLWCLLPDVCCCCCCCCLSSALVKMCSKSVRNYEQLDSLNDKWLRLRRRPLAVAQRDVGHIELSNLLTAFKSKASPKLCQHAPCLLLLLLLLETKWATKNMSST